MCRRPRLRGQPLWQISIGDREGDEGKSPVGTFGLHLNVSLTHARSTGNLGESSSMGSLPSQTWSISRCTAACHLGWCTIATSQYESGPATVKTPTRASMPRTDDASWSPEKHDLCAVLSRYCLVQHQRISPWCTFSFAPRYRSIHQSCCSSWRFLSARFHGLRGSGKCHSGVNTLVMGPAGDICRRRPQALLVQCSEMSGSSQVRVHMTLEHISSSEA